MNTRDMVNALEREGLESYKALAPYRVDVPCGKAGPWTIDQFETKFDLHYMRYARDGRAPGLGKFTRLGHKERGVVMSDTNAEIDDLRCYLGGLTGDVLITGLGLGMVVHCLTRLPRYSEQITSITVVEKDKDILKLAADHYRKDPRVTIINADAYKWEPAKGQMFDSAWHDIWDTICADNAFGKMRRHYQRAMRKPGAQHCWGEAYAKYGNRRGWG